MLKKFNNIDEGLMDKLSGPSLEEVSNNLRKKYEDGEIDIFKYYRKAEELGVDGPSDLEIKKEYDIDSRKFIERAIINGCYNYVKYAIDKGVDLNKTFSNYSHLAVIYERPKTLQLLLDKGIEYNIGAFRAAYEGNNKEIIDMLEKHFNMTYEKFCNKNPQQYLYLSVRKNDLEGVKKAIQLGADVNKVLDINLHYSIVHSFEEIALCLIFHGATIDKKVIDVINDSKCKLLKQIIKWY